ncbi:hypothetical protein GII33_08310 [Gordonia pseudamarae]|uniref:PI3K/PI4K catalytic domain-containing protein n=1 Tax=Gordonia pseudamarae TaxID=2831662 RepID=A0ABX6IGA6_9ACTN|nr:MULTISPECIES: hypothetical protein [Gordonia]MBD0024114.1 hypothetical protein [Gordonia sp. (in: high G+C Gram-positive bacteria)]QHN25963.1 hypothetical protein GII33_08310 [Gordonia pseudamarae]QHN34894.1 hypothetical protein GII31_08290 [Gordonia pseudamarae]
MAPRKLRPGVRIDDLVRVDDPDDPDATETYWGRAWMHVTKHNPDEPYRIANELICGRLAAALGLPVLPGEVARDRNGTIYWAVPGVRSDGGTSAPPSSTHDIAIAQPQVVAGMIVFDAWVNNTGRHAESVLYDERLGIWLVDHGYSLARPRGHAFAEKPDDEALIPLRGHEFADEAIDKELLRFWEQRVQAVSAHVIGRPLLEANQRGLITQRQQSWLAKYLLARRDRIVSLVPSADTPAEPEFTRPVLRIVPDTLF